jgi:hypothetical protein
MEAIDYGNPAYFEDKVECSQCGCTPEDCTIFTDADLNTLCDNCRDLKEFYEKN